MSKLRPHWRKMTWVLVVFTALMFTWMIGGGISAGSECNDAAGQYASAKQAGCETGTAIGVAAIFTIWFFGFVVLSLIWFMTRPKGRDCPACGTKVKRGLTACGSCGHDFASAAAAQGAAQATQFGPGWYPYSAEPGTERYWTGSAWAEQQRPIAVR